MGEVYRAKDTRLDRIVAIKILPPHVAERPAARQRFEREARAVASLNHPHICTLYDIGRENGIDFLVLEFLEGETLARRLATGPLPAEEVLRFGIQMADALAQAHRQGVFHRDLKPGNVMLTRSGVKLLDFGLAKLRGPETTPAADGLSGAPTEDALTREGTILGTFQYMAPEQLQGKATDARSEVFAFGAVLYEMVTGRKAFEGDNQAVMVAILTSQPPPISAVRPAADQPLGRALDRLVKTCLAKDPDDRWQTMQDLKLQLQWIVEESAQPGIPASTGIARKNRQALAWTVSAVLALLLVVALVAGVVYLRRPAEQKDAVRFSVYPPPTASFGDLGATGPVTISPDGRLLAFVAFGPDGSQLLWARPLDSLAAQALAGTDGAVDPFWSPDSRFIGFFAQGKLKKIEIGAPAGPGPPQTLCDAVQPRGGTWNRDGVILFSANTGDRLYRVSAAGGAAAPLALEQPNLETMRPYFLPDGLHFLYLGRPQKWGIYVASLNSKEAKFLVGDRSPAAYAPSGNGQAGYLLYWREGTLVAQPFDSGRLQIAGEPSPIAERVGHNWLHARAAFSVSETGVLVHRGADDDLNTELAWFDRGGKQLASVGAPGPYRRLSLSPDEKKVALERADFQARTADIWLIDVARGIESRFTFDPGLDILPVWSPDGSRIVFGASRGGPPILYQKASSGAGSEELLIQSGTVNHPTDWSRDGRFIVYANLDRQKQWDLWILPGVEGTPGDRKPFPFLQTNFSEHYARFSPNGRWLAYASDESGKWEVYVQPFPKPGRKSQISTAGGTQPQWRRDGKELFYLAADRKLMAAAVTEGATFEAGAPRMLFQTRMPAPFGQTRFGGSSYAVAADGQRLLIVTEVTEATPAPATVLLNWMAQLRR